MDCPTQVVARLKEVLLLGFPPGPLRKQIICLFREESLNFFFFLA